MQQQEGLSTKLWLEKYEERNHATQTSILEHKFKFKKNTLELIQAFQKKSQMNWDVFVPLISGIIFNRLSPSSSIVFGCSQFKEKKSGKLKIEFPVKPVISTFDLDTTIKTYITKFKSQWKNKSSLDDEYDLHIRYLVLSQIKESIKDTHVVSTDRYPLILIYTQKGEFNFIYNPNIFTTEMIEALSDRLEIIANELCQSPLSKKISSLNLLSDSEKKQIFYKWKEGAYPFSIPQLSGYIQDYFIEQVSHNPSQIAISHNDKQYTYEELDQASTRLAKNLFMNGVKSGDRVAVVMNRSINAIVALFAVIKCGGIYVPISTENSCERISYILDDCKPKRIVTSDSSLIPNKYEKKITLFSGDWPQLTDYSFNLFNDNSNQVAAIIYTSGTTGQSKGVMLSHRNILNLIAWYRACFHINNQDRSSQFASDVTNAFFCEVLPFLTSGASVYIADDSMKYVPNLFFNWLDKNQITICDVPTAYAHVLLTHQWPKQLNLRILKISGERLNHYPMQKFAFDIWHTYGSVECTFEATYMKLYTANAEYNHMARKVTPPIGRPIAQSKIYVVDQYKQPVPVGVAGELWISGCNTALGYFNQTDLNKNKFISNVFDSEKNEMIYCTGDLVRWLPDGNLEYVERMDHDIIVQQYQINLSDVENLINQYPDVNQVMVLAKDYPNQKKSMVVYVSANLDKSRYIYQTKCMLMVDDHYYDTLTEDISKEGLALYGVNAKIKTGTKIKVYLSLPGMSEGKEFSGKVIWQQNQRMGIIFSVNENEKSLIEKSIDYYLSTHNIMDLVLNSSHKRSLKKALQNQVPEYMQPSIFVTLPQFPYALSGKIDKKALLDFSYDKKSNKSTNKTDGEKSDSNLNSNEKELS